MKYVALLRGINVGGNKMIAMADLTKLALKLGYTNPRTFLQSGNLVFEGKTQSTAKIEQILEAETKKRCGVETTYFVRTGPEWQAVIDANPFPDEAKSDPARLLVKFEREPATAAAVKALAAAAVSSGEKVRAVGREWYIHYPDGLGNSKLARTREGRAFGASGTARNWNTILKVAAAL